MNGGKSKVVTIIAGIFIVGSALWALALALAIKPVASLELQTGPVVLEPTGQEITFAWPTQGVAAVGMDGKVKADFNGNQVQPMASLAKVITALVVLEKRPFNSGEFGETIVMTEKDVALYEKTKALGGSNIAVTAGENISQADLLRAVMLVSANNVADSLANWAFESEEAYITAANDWLARNGFTSTKVADASGLNSNSVSTANEMIKLAMLADKNTTLRSIFSQKEGQFPGVGKISNTNILLGVDGIYGLKTGHTEAAGANLLFVSEYRIGEEKKAIYGVVMGQVDGELFNVAKDLNESAQQNVGKVVALAKGAIVGQVISQWGDKVNMVLTSDLVVTDWKDENDAIVAVNAVNSLSGMTSVAGGQRVAVANSGFAEANVVTEKTLRAPGLLWRISHPF
jgi:D-alanyl-D-alanine carboxypeptidase (penicillin-binding protein 5/6)